MTAKVSDMVLVDDGPPAQVLDTRLQEAIAASLAFSSVSAHTTEEDTSLFGSMAAHRCCAKAEPGKSPMHMPASINPRISILRIFTPHERIVPLMISVGAFSPRRPVPSRHFLAGEAAGPSR